ncbi:epithelial mitogen L homeolog [Xenopus laevis]|nr:epithelial mitogen L homeolog [Xenopus laevis]AAI33276.1 LOC100037165 protein [Xenopus laevis]
MIVLSEEYSVTKSPELTSKIEGREQEFIKDGNPCYKEYLNYCLNGQCLFHADLTTPLCRCDSSFTGERCEHMTLPAYSHDEEAVYIAIGIGVGLLISGAIFFIWYYWKKRCKKPVYETCEKTDAI